MSGRLIIPNKTIRIANESIDTNVLNDSLNVNNFIWSTSSLDWVRCTTSTSGEPVVAVTNFPATQAVSGSISVDNFPATQAVIVNNLSTITVLANDLDIRNINATSDVIQAKSYGECISQNLVSGIVKWSKIGYTPTTGINAESEIWSAGTTYTFITSAAGLEVVSSDNTQDIGTVIKSGTADAGSSTTSLLDADVNFTTATAVATGDCVILDKSGVSPEWGYVTGVSTNTLTIGNGFSSGGNPSGRTYSVVDKSAYTNAQAVKVEYLDETYAEKSEIIILNGTSVVPTVNLDLFRINSFRIIATGSANIAKGNLSIRNLADTPIYSYITAGYTRARNAQYTVPLGKTLWVTSINAGFSTTGKASLEYARIYTRANVEPSTGFNTGSIFFPYSEILSTGDTIPIPLIEPTKLIQKTDIKVSIISSASGIATVALRGYLVTN